MAYPYKITDLDALEAAQPKAVTPEQIVIKKKPNHTEVGRLFRASQTLGIELPGVRAKTPEELAADKAEPVVDDSAKPAAKKASEKKPQPHEVLSA